MKVDINGEKVKLVTEDATIVYRKMGLRENILKALSNPNIAYILFLIGLAGLYFELSNPGAVFPGVTLGCHRALSHVGQAGPDRLVGGVRSGEPGPAPAWSV